MIEFGDLFNAKSNPVKNPVYKPLEKELKSLFNEFSKENANNFRKHIDSDKQVDYDERIHQYYSALPDSSDLKDELVSFFKNEGIIKKFELDPSEQENANAEEIFNHNASLSSPPDVLSMSYIYLMTPIAPLYTLDNFIQELCFLNNPDCPVFLQQTNAFWDDIFNALIFNLNYKRRKSLKIKYDSISMQALYALYNDSVGEPICQSLIPKAIIRTNFCRYSTYTLFTYDATHKLTDKSFAKSRSFYSLFTTLHEDSSKNRTFRNVLNAISCPENLTPKIEDQWYLEKILGFNTVTAIYPFVAKFTISKAEATEITISILKILMKCQPLRTRIFLAKVMSRAASSFQYLFQNSSTRCNQIYSETFQKVLLEPLSKTVNFVNQVYFTTLKALYNAVQARLIPYSKIKGTYDQVNNFNSYLPCLAAPSYYGLSKKNLRGLKAFLYPQDASQLILDFFPFSEATVKTICSKRNDSALFSLLQTTAIKEILKNYNIQY